MKKRLIIAGVIMVTAMLIVAAALLPGTWSKVSFDAIVREGVVEQDGAMSLTAERITKTYGNPLCALHIAERTKTIDENGNKISVRDIQTGDTIKMTLKNLSIEGNPPYYPTVFEIKVVSRF